MAEKTNHPLWLKLVVFGSVAVGINLLLQGVRADPPAGDQTAAPTLLQQLSDETRREYLQSRHSMVRVRLPTPDWLEQYNQQQLFMKKWGPKLDPAVRDKFLQEQARSLANLRHAATQPIARGNAATQPDHTSLPGSMAATSGIHLGDIASDGRLMLFAVGLLVDNEGHAMFPVFVDRKSIGDSPLLAVTGDGLVTTAKFLGSDAKTNITVLQLAKSSGTPAALGHIRPEDGTLTLVIAPDASARLVVWTNQHPEPGFAVLPDGSVAGFGFDGHFLCASTAKPIVDQLIATGEVRRAVLGVLTAEVSRYDPIRQSRPELGSSPAIRVLAVQEGSAAAIGGVKQDDLVLAIGNDLVGDAPTFAAVIATRSGKTVLRVLRGSQVIPLTVNLQPR